MAARAVKKKKKKKKKKTSNDILSVTTGRISTEFDRIVPWEAFYQKSFRSAAQNGHQS